MFLGRKLRYWEVWAGGVRLVKEMVEGAGCQRHPAGVGMPLASRCPLGGGAVPPCRRHGGRFRVAARAQLREIAAEKETTCKKTKGWIYSWGAQLRLCGWSPSFSAPIGGVRWEAGWYGDGSASCPNGGARNRLGHERNERNDELRNLATSFISFISFVPQHAGMSESPSRGSIVGIM